MASLSLLGLDASSANVNDKTPWMKKVKKDPIPKSITLDVVILCCAQSSLIMVHKHNSVMKDTYDIPLERVLNDSISNNEVLEMKKRKRIINVL